MTNRVLHLQVVAHAAVVVVVCVRAVAYVAGVACTGDPDVLQVVQATSRVYPIKTRFTRSERDFVGKHDSCSGACSISTLTHLVVVAPVGVRVVALHAIACKGAV